jgi:NDP-sugar pyrophosphorylase family protein
MLPVLILAGGIATRLRPVTERVPKALVELCGEPFLAHQLRLLRDNGIQFVVLSVAYRGEMIREWAGDGTRFGLRIEYVFDGPVLLGTGGAVKRALPLLGQEFFVLYGDSYLPCNFRAVQQAFLASDRLGMMTVFHNQGQWDSSNVEFADGRILAYDKNNRTPAMHHIDYGLGVFRREAFDTKAEGTPIDLAQIYQDLLRRGQLAAFEVGERFYEIGSPEGLMETEKFLALRLNRTRSC